MRVGTARRRPVSPAAVVVQLKAQNAALEMELRVKVRPFSAARPPVPACVSSVVRCTLHVARCVLRVALEDTCPLHVASGTAARARARMRASGGADCGSLLCACPGAREARARAPVRQRGLSSPPAHRPAQPLASRRVAQLGAAAEKPNAPCAVDGRQECNRRRSFVRGFALLSLIYRVEQIGDDLVASSASGAAVPAP